MSTVQTSQSLLPYLRIFIAPSKKKGAPVFVWQQIEKPVAPDSIVLSGKIAERVQWLLMAYGSKRQDPDFFDVREPVCHGAAFYAAGLIDDPAPYGHFADIYTGLEEILTYDKPQPPAVVHLLKAKIPPRKLHEANELICPHTVLYIGDLHGREVCFQKHIDGATSIGFLRNAERKYNTTYRLWVNA